MADDKAGVSPAGGTAMRAIQRFLAGFSLCVLLGSPASAATITWTLNNVTFADGGTATGTFGYDADTNNYSAISITTSGGSMAGSIYGVVDPPPSIKTASAVAFINTANAGFLPNHTLAHRLLLYFTAPLTNVGGTVNVATGFPGFSSEGICQTATCLPPPTGGNIRFVTGGTVSASPVPVPAAAWLFGGAVGVLGWLKRRQATA